MMTHRNRATSLKLKIISEKKMSAVKCKQSFPLYIELKHQKTIDQENLCLRPLVNNGKKLQIVQKTKQTV